MNRGLLSSPNLILASDLNFTLNAADIWGKKHYWTHLALSFHSSSLIMTWWKLPPLVQGLLGGMEELGMRTLVNNLIDS